MSSVKNKISQKIESLIIQSDFLILELVFENVCIVSFNKCNDSCIHFKNFNFLVCSKSFLAWQVWLTTFYLFNFKVLSFNVIKEILRLPFYWKVFDEQLLFCFIFSILVKSCWFNNASPSIIFLDWLDKIIEHFFRNRVNECSISITIFSDLIVTCSEFVVFFLRKFKIWFLEITRTVPLVINWYFWR